MLHWRIRRVKIEIVSRIGFFRYQVRQTVRLLWHRFVLCPFIRRQGYLRNRNVNLCCGSTILPGYWNIDLNECCDLMLDLESVGLPFPDESMDAVVCISAINYFTRRRGATLIQEVHRVLRRGGVARFATQDLRRIARLYVEKDRGFFFQTLPDGRERFEGKTMADKINTWFYGYMTSRGKVGRYFYDFETLALLFREAGFRQIEERNYQESRIAGIENIDNRPEQMFFLEAVK